MLSLHPLAYKKISCRTWKSRPKQITNLHDLLERPQNVWETLGEGNQVERKFCWNIKINQAKQVFFLSLTYLRTCQVPVTTNKNFIYLIPSFLLGTTILEGPWPFPHSSLFSSISLFPSSWYPSFHVIQPSQLWSSSQSWSPCINFYFFAFPSSILSTCLSQPKFTGNWK